MDVGGAGGARNGLVDHAHVNEMEAEALVDADLGGGAEGEDGVPDDLLLAERWRKRTTVKLGIGTGAMRVDVVAFENLDRLVEIVLGAEHVNHSVSFGLDCSQRSLHFKRASVAAIHLSHAVGELRGDGCQIGF